MNVYLNIWKWWIVLTVLPSHIIRAQSPSDYLPGKPGKWIMNIKAVSQSSAEKDYTRNVVSVAEWFHQHVHLLSQLQGFDLAVTSYSIWDNHYKINPVNYGMRSEMSFEFQLFLADKTNGGKWTVEPPHYHFYINNTESGHQSRGNFPYFNDQQDDPKSERAINAAAVNINGLIAAFPYVRNLAPGVDVYQESADGDKCHIIVYNPERPPYWLEITVKEAAAIYLEYYSLYQKTEMDKKILEQLKKEIAELSPEELAAPAYQGHDTHFVFPVNGQNQGLKLVRFNPGYWDKSLPASAIQLMTFWYPQMSNAQMEEFYKDNGYPNYNQLLVNQVNWSEVAGLITKTRPK